MDKIKELANELTQVNEWPDFGSGDTLTAVSYTHLTLPTKA